jgi:PH domain
MFCEEQAVEIELVDGVELTVPEGRKVTYRGVVTCGSDVRATVAASRQKSGNKIEWKHRFEFALDANDDGKKVSLRLIVRTDDDVKHSYGTLEYPLPALSSVERECLLPIFSLQNDEFCGFLCVRWKWSGGKANAMKVPVKSRLYGSDVALIEKHIFEHANQGSDDNNDDDEDYLYNDTREKQKCVLQRSVSNNNVNNSNHNNGGGDKKTKNGLDSRQRRVDASTLRYFDEVAKQMRARHLQAYRYVQPLFSVQFALVALLYALLPVVRLAARVRDVFAWRRRLASPLALVIVLFCWWHNATLPALLLGALGALVYTLYRRTTLAPHASAFDRLPPSATMLADMTKASRRRQRRLRRGPLDEVRRLPATIGDDREDECTETLASRVDAIVFAVNEQLFDGRDMIDRRALAVDSNPARIVAAALRALTGSVERAADVLRWRNGRAAAIVTALCALLFVSASFVRLEPLLFALASNAFCVFCMYAFSIGALAKRYAPARRFHVATYLPPTRPAKLAEVDKETESDNDAEKQEEEQQGGTQENDETSSNLPTDRIAADWLHRKRQGRGNWSRRVFVLQPRSLCYYRSMQELSPSNTLPLDSRCLIWAYANDTISRPHAFSILNTARNVTWTMAADNAETFARWFKLAVGVIRGGAKAVAMPDVSKPVASSSSASGGGGLALEQKPAPASPDADGGEQKPAPASDDANDALAPKSVAAPPRSPGVALEQKPSPQSGLATSAGSWTRPTRPTSARRISVSTDAQRSHAPMSSSADATPPSEPAPLPPTKRQEDEEEEEEKKEKEKEEEMEDNISLFDEPAPLPPIEEEENDLMTPLFDEPAPLPPVAGDDSGGSSSTSERRDGVIESGWISKKQLYRGLFAPWKERYLELDTKSLAWFDDDLKRKGGIALKELALEQANVTVRDNKSHQFVLTNVAKQKSYLVATHTDESRATWIAAIEGALANIQTSARPAFPEPENVAKPAADARPKTPDLGDGATAGDDDGDDQLGAIFDRPTSAAAAPAQSAPTASQNYWRRTNYYGKSKPNANTSSWTRAQPRFPSD